MVKQIIILEKLSGWNKNELWSKLKWWDLFELLLYVIYNVFFGQNVCYLMEIFLSNLGILNFSGDLKELQWLKMLNKWMDKLTIFYKPAYIDELIMILKLYMLPLRSSIHITDITYYS